jgi:hypothetical protein
VTEVLERPAATGSDRAAWRRLGVRAVLLPAVVLAPLTTLALSGDHRFNVYWHGSAVVSRPWALVTDNLRTVPMYLDFGNFRPLGRMLEWTVDLAAYVLMAVLHLPAEVALRLVAALAAAVLTGVAAVFTEAVTARGRMFAEPPPVPVALVPLALAGCLVAAGGLSTTVLFGGLYYLSAALVLGVAAWIARGPRRVWPVLLVGAALAAFNEVGALALPLATVVAVIRVFVVGGDVGLWTALKSCRTGRVYWPHPVPGWGAAWAAAKTAYRTKNHPIAWLWLGFLPIFLPVRVLIFLACRDGACYRSSDLALGPAAAAALPDRLTAWLPPVQWFAALRGASTPSRLAMLAALLLFALITARLLADVRRLPSLERRPAIALAAAGLTVLLLGAALGSVNPQEQAARWGLGWRDSALTATGGALILVTLLSRLTPKLVVPLLALIAAFSAVANDGYAATSNQTRPAQVDNAIAAAIAQFDLSAAGRTQRCALQARFGQVFPATGYSRFAQGELPGTHSPGDRLAVTASMATEQLYGRPFC